MHFGRILEGLWDGRVRPIEMNRHGALCDLIQALMPVRSVCLSDAGARGDRIAVFGDDSELAPDLPIGDVIAEELDIEVADSSLVFLVPARIADGAAPAADLSRAVGAAVARAIVHLAERGMLIIEHELGAIRSLATVYQDLAGTERFERAGLAAEPFRAGFAEELHALFGWPVMSCENAEPRPGLSAAQRALKIQIEALGACGRTLDRDTFADIATHLAAADAREGGALHLGVRDGV